MMKLRLQTDYALRVLLYLAHSEGRVTAGDIATAYAISKAHIVKVVQQLAKAGWIRTMSGPTGGIKLVGDPATITVRDIFEEFEGVNGLIECVPSPEVCPMEPGCGLRLLLIEAESAFLKKLQTKTIRDLVGEPRQSGGIYNLPSRS